MMQTRIFQYDFNGDGLVDVGRKRTENQDEIILAFPYGFFAVSDGMGGFANGGRTSAMIKQVLPGLIREAVAELLDDFTYEHAAELLSEKVTMISDNIYDSGNKGQPFAFGATLTGVWLVGECAVFVNLGDSRGYLLSHEDERIRQITQDHSLAAYLVAQKEITEEEALSHPARGRLRRFVGMTAPAKPETFICQVSPGDHLLLCSDGLHGMVRNEDLSQIIRSSENADPILKRLIDTANENGGADNISAIHIAILPKRV